MQLSRVTKHGAICKLYICYDGNLLTKEKQNRLNYVIQLKKEIMNNKN